MKSFKFCYHWADFGGTGYVLANTVQEATQAIKNKFPQYDEKNTRHTRQGFRECRKCRSIWEIEDRRKKRVIRESAMSY